MKRLWLFFLSLSKSHQITMIVFIVHATIILFGFAGYLFTKKNIKKQILIVTTFVPRIDPLQMTPSIEEAQPQAPKKVSFHTQVPSQMATAKKIKEEPSKLRPEEQKIALKRAAPTPHSGIKTLALKDEVVLNANRELLSQLAKSLDAVTTASPIRTTVAPLSLPKIITTKTELEPSSMKNLSYAEHLIELLTYSLDLPEFGAVKASIEIDASGSLFNCTILEQKSRKNSEFLKNRLRELTFPCFNDFGLSDNRLKFTITFRNLES